MQRHYAVKNPSTIFALMLAVTLIAIGLVAFAIPASAQTSLSQCNGTDNVGGQAVECHYTVTNNLDGTDTSSTVTLTECHGAANDPPTLVCTPSTTTSPDLVTTVNQCNGSGNGGGGTVVCTVDIVNNITGTMTPTAATVNQCNASGTGGGTAPTVLCDPFPANTTGATVTQCNESGNGGGGTQRVQCTVDSDSTVSVIEVTVNQCNGSGNGGGATVTCRTGLTNVITAAQPEPEPEPSASPTGGTGGPDTEGPTGGTGGGPSGSGGGDTSGPNTPGAPADTTGQVVRVPTGGVGAGGGATSGIEYLGLLTLGLSLIGVGSFGLIVRRRVGARV